MTRYGSLILIVICLAACRLASPDETLNPGVEVIEESAPPALATEDPVPTEAADIPIVTEDAASPATQNTGANANSVEFTAILPQNTASASNTVQKQPASISVSPCQPRTDWQTYTVVAGDTLYSLATRADSTVAQVMQANCLADADVLSVGQTLWLPVLLPPQTSTNTDPFAYSDCAMTLLPIGARLEAYDAADRLNSTMITNTLSVGAQFPVVAVSEYRAQVVFPDGSRGWIERYMGRLDGFCGAIDRIQIFAPAPTDGCYMRIDTTAESTMLNLREQPGGGEVVAAFPKSVWVQAITFGHPDAFEFRLADGRTGWIINTSAIHNLGMRAGDCHNLPVHRAEDRPDFNCQITFFAIGAPHIAYDRATRTDGVIVATGLTAGTTLDVIQLSEYRVQLRLQDEGNIGWVEGRLGELTGDCTPVPRIQTVPPAPTDDCYMRTDSVNGTTVPMYENPSQAVNPVAQFPDATWVRAVARGDHAQGYGDTYKMQLADGREAWLLAGSTIQASGMVSGNCEALPIVALAPGG